LDVPPHPLFDPEWYLSQLPRRPKDQTLLEHYLTEGRALSPHPCFDPQSPAAQAAPLDRNPLRFYLTHASQWRLSPNPLFDGHRYRARYPDVRAARVNPLVHFVMIGDGEERIPGAASPLWAYRRFFATSKTPGAGSLTAFLRDHRPAGVHAGKAARLDAVEDPAQIREALASARWEYTAQAITRRARLYTSLATVFDPEWYSRQRFGTGLDAGDGGEVLHGTVFDDYLLRGAALGLSPHPLFDQAFYLTQVARIPAGMLPVEHYLAEGASRSPHPAFDPASPAAAAAPPGTNPLIHYLTDPTAWHLAPNEVFDGAYYLDKYPDVLLAQMNPLVHFLAYGEAERRTCSLRFDPKRYRAIEAVPMGESTIVHYLRRRYLPESFSPLELSFPACPEPEVSIVIPVYGQWAHTQACLMALAHSDPDPTFEIIVVDDAGPDATADLLSLIPDIRVIRHETNTGYVGACNTGIAAARGKYVVLLNNDTQVADDWLAPLVETLESEGVGLVGAKLVYPDGTLQEAGGIIFSDGSGYNYGTFANPEDSSYSYRRSVDYCSGAAIIARRSTFEELGGLDETFAPAYYDDTDLAFSVRSLGLDVVYEPRSVVIHDEGVSHGTDETRGIKAYQAINKAKFQAKWAEALTHQLPPVPSVPERGARARQGKDLVIVVDHYVPRTDQDSGSVRMAALIQELRRQDHGVVFVPNDGSASGRYGKALRGAGVEVAFGSHEWPEFFSALHGSVAAVIVSRVSTALNFVPVLRAALPGVPIIFDTVDVHFLRLEREAALTEEEGMAESAALVRELELALVRSCDTTLVVSPVEKELLTSLVPGADVRVISNVHAKVDDAAIPPLAGRDGVVFVGSFAHPPNQDAVNWFIEEVLPLVWDKRPDLPVRIVGADPPEDLVDTAPPGVEYLGWVEDLAAVYGESRAAIAPLRFGAGVKGKIGEAMAYGIPVVTTTVGAEGMTLDDGVTAVVADSPEAFAEGILRLMDDAALWESISTAAREHIDRILGPTGFATAVRGLIPDRRT
jgi:GT2 family glycosyltransferase/glycosyltransferase involved in cell wall biosynthesis